jgi:hypothetical protein
MGVSTNAELWFGLCWEESDEPGYENGLPSPVIEYLTAKYADEVEELEESEKLEKLEDSAHELVEKRSCTLVVYGYGDGGAMFGLAVRGTDLTAWRGHPRDVSADSIITTGTMDKEHIESLRKAAEAIGWPYKEPAWWLASYWG